MVNTLTRESHVSRASEVSLKVLCSHLQFRSVVGNTEKDMKFCLGGEWGATFFFFFCLFLFLGISNPVWVCGRKPTRT